MYCIFWQFQYKIWHAGVSAVEGRRWQMQEHVLAEGLGWFSLEKGRICGEITGRAHEEAVRHREPGSSLLCLMSCSDSLGRS